MRYIVATTLIVSTMLAGPELKPVVDYDKVDIYEAKEEEIKSLPEVPITTPTPVVTPVVAPTPKFDTPSPIKESRVDRSGCSNNSIEVLGGMNFTFDDSDLKNAPSGGARFNKCLTNNLSVQIGYDHLFKPKYKKSKLTRVLSFESGRGLRLARVDVKSRVTKYDHTNIDRFYLNGVYEIANDNSLFPYILGGGGYEYVTDEAFDTKSGAFLDGGVGVKYRVGSNINLLLQAKAIRKFTNGDIDILATLGAGWVF